MYNAASELCNNLLKTYFDEYYELPDAKRNEMERNYNPIDLFLETYNHDIWFETE